MSNQKCNKCQKIKKLDQFAFKNKSKNIVQKSCKQCHREYSKKHYNQNKEYYSKKASKHSKIVEARNKQIISEHKLNGCKYCQENDPCCLEFHHTNGDKKYNVSNLTKHSLETLEKEISKCEVVCANCHRKIHAGKLKK